MADDEFIQPENPDTSGESSIEKRLEEFDRALDKAREAMEAEKVLNKWEVNKWTILCILVVVMAGFVCFYFYSHHEELQDTWTWQVIYFSVMRIAIVTGIFALASFCFKMLRSYSQIEQKNRRRLFLIKSMSGLIQSGTQYLDRKIAHEKFLETILESDKTGLLTDDADFKLNSEAISLLKTIVDKVSTKE